jgi:hypothetical protein
VRDLISTGLGDSEKNAPGNRIQSHVSPRPDLRLKTLSDAKSMRCLSNVSCCCRLRGRKLLTKLSRENHFESRTEASAKRSLRHVSAFEAEPRALDCRRLDGEGGCGGR